MANITVQPLSGDQFKVIVSDGSGTSVHEVTATKEDLQRYGGESAAEQLLKASFEFLLEREPKDSILSSFHLSVIERYFPEYPTEIQQYLK